MEALLKGNLKKRRDSRLRSGQLATQLQAQLLDGNSKLAFIFSLAPSQRQEAMETLVNLAIDAARLVQSNIQHNHIAAEKSELIRLKDEIEKKENQIHSIGFQMSQKRGSQARLSTPKASQDGEPTASFRHRLSQTSKGGGADGDLAGDRQRKNSIINQKSLEEKDQQQLQVNKFRLINQINLLNRQILRQESVAKFMEQFHVNEKQ